MQNPNLLLVDEPTASLDPKTSRQIMRLICELAHERGTPALVNIHDVGLAQNFSDRVVGLSEGRLIFDGPTAGLTAEVLTQIYGEEDWSQTIRRDDDDSEGDGDIPPTSDSQDERVRGEAAAG
jgi:phosphonate transport system ATP-binding protein